MQQHVITTDGHEPPTIRLRHEFQTASNIIFHQYTYIFHCRHFSLHPHHSKPSKNATDATQMTRSLHHLSPAPHIPKQPSPMKNKLHQCILYGIFYYGPIDHVMGWPSGQIRPSPILSCHCLSRRAISTNFEIWECWATCFGISVHILYLLL